ncbi:MAG: hypothetical protein R3B70_21425 [Polyangiaceae bacterium]
MPDSSGMGLGGAPSSSRWPFSSEHPGEPSSRRGLDVLSHNEGDLPRKRDARDAGTDVVAALFRLVKLSTMHTTDNQAVVQKVEEMVEAVRNYGARAGRNISILFLDDTVLVGGLLLQANRSMYDCARELGSLLARLGVSEVGISKEARAADFYALATALSEALRGPRGTRIAERPTPRVRMRAASPLALREQATDKLDPLASAANAYASACVVMRRLYDALGKGKLTLPHRVKRVAQRLVDLSAGEMPAFLGVTDAKRGGHDEAQRAVNAAIIALAMARQVTSDPVVLSRIAMAALLFDVGRYHVAGAFPGPSRLVPRLGEEQERRVPASTAMLLTAMGRVNEPSVMRTVMAYEACAVSSRDAVGLTYDGARPATLQAELVAVARAYVDAVSTQLGSLARTADDAVAVLHERFPDSLGRTATRLLIGALGLFPSGTLVELTTGEVAAVVATQVDPALYSLPTVRVVLDMAGHPVDVPFEVDLAHPAPGDPPRRIRRVVTGSMDVAPVSVRAPMSARSAPIMPPAPTSRPGARSIPPTLQPGPLRARATEGLPARDDRSKPRPTRPDRPAMQGEIDHAWHVPDLTTNPPPVISDVPPPDETLESAEAVGDRSSNPLTISDIPEVVADRTSNPISISDIPVVGIGAPPTLRPSDETPTPIALGPTPSPIALGPTPTPIALGPTPIALGPTLGSHPQPAPEPEGVDRTRQYTREESDLVAATAPPPMELSAAIVEAPRPEPTAQGTFAKTPLVHLLVYILDQALTGTATFFPAEGMSHDVYFDEGIATKIRTGSMIWPLDRVLVQDGLVPEHKLTDALVEISRTRMLLGRYLVAKGLLSREAVLGALRRQLVLKLVSLCELPPETSYAFYAGENLIKGYGGPEPLRSEPLATIMAAVRASPGTPAAQATLSRIARIPVGVVPGSDLSRFELSREEEAVCDLLRARRMRLPELLDAGAAPEHVVKRTIYALTITRYLDLGVQQKPPVAFQPSHVPTERPPVEQAEVPRARPSPRVAVAAAPPIDRREPPPAREPVAREPVAREPVAREPVAREPVAREPVARAGKPGVDLAARRAEIEARAASIDGESYFDVLGVSHRPRTTRSAPPISPSPSAGTRTAPGRPRRHEAHDRPRLRAGSATPTPPSAIPRSARPARRAWQAGGGARGAVEEEQVVRAVNAALEAQKAEALLRKNDLAGAERHARLAEGCPIPDSLNTPPSSCGSPPFAAASPARSRKRPRLPAIIRRSHRHARRGPPRRAPLLTRSLLSRHAPQARRRPDKAIRDFRLAAELNPKNLDAVREVRLHEMQRDTKDAGAEGGGGLFGKWFKR